MWILNFLLKPQESKPILITKTLGCFFLMLAGILGAYFLFQALIPQLGYLESGGVICGLFTILGIVLLLMTQKKTITPQEEVSQKLLNIIKDFNIEKILKDNALTLSLLSLGVGILLSQLPNSKKLSEIYKIFK